MSLGDIGNIMKQAQQLQERLAQVQDDVARRTVEAASGGGMVKVKVNGHLEVQKMTLSDEAAKITDRELLEDLVVAAVNQALKKARQLVAEETSKMATGLGLPPGMNLPGLS